jgi:hypothetical protein
MLTVFALGLVVGVGLGLLVGPPPRVVRFYSVPPDDVLQARNPGYLPAASAEKGTH